MKFTKAKFFRIILLTVAANIFAYTGNYIGSTTILYLSLPLALLILCAVLAMKIKYFQD